jgi:ABC-type lipoprotein release transport system permease subunit
MGTGHVAIQAPGYLESSDLDDRLGAAESARAISAIETVLTDELVAWAPRLSVNGLASSAASALPVRIEGVDPTRERAFSDIEDKVQEGRYLEPGDRLHAYVGIELARRLDLKVGSRFVLTAQSASGDIEGQLVRVSGIFRTFIPEVDQALVHIPIETAREWLRTPGAASTLALLLRGARETDRAVEALRGELAAEPNVRVLGWREASAELDAALRIDDYGDYVFHSILFAIVALAVLNAVMMSVLGRRREFGVLQALGLTGAETGMIVFGEGIFLTAVSGAVGVVAGFILTWGFFRNGLDLSRLVDSEAAFAGAGGIIDPVIIPVFHTDQILLSVYFILIIGALSATYPAWRASKLDVAEAMKFEQ